MVGTDPAILWPAVAQAGLTYAVWLRLFVARMRHMRARPPRPEDFATNTAALAYFEPVEPPANNLRNLFEMPVLFFAIVGLLFATGLGGAAQVALAWGYVLLRAGHSWVHVTRGPVKRRFLLYLASCMLLAAMWVGFAIDLAGVGGGA